MSSRPVTAQGRLVFVAGPLSGASIVVTRPAAMAQTLRSRVRALGGAPVALPGLVLRGVPEVARARAALRTARAADVAIFVSPAAVRFAFGMHPRLGFGRGTMVCALGAGTLAALARKGVSRAVAPDREDSEGLLALPGLRGLRGKRVVLIGAAGGRDVLAPELRKRRARVEEIHVYERLAPRFSRAQLAALEQAPAPLLTLVSSGEVLANLRANLPLMQYARLAESDLIVSSERLAQLARASLFGRVHVAASAAPADLLQSACAVLARHRL